MVAGRNATFESGALDRYYDTCQLPISTYRRSERKRISAHAQSTSMICVMMPGVCHPVAWLSAIGLRSTSVAGPTRHHHWATDVQNFVSPPSNHCSSAAARAPCSPTQAPHSPGSGGQLLPVAAHKPPEPARLPEASSCCSTATRQHNVRIASQVARYICAESECSMTPGVCASKPSNDVIVTFARL